MRYADDFIVLCASEEQARQALALIQQWVASAGLVLHPVKTRIVDATQKGGFDFLGYHFERGMKWPRQKSLEKLKDTIRKKTPRNHGQSLEQIIADVNRTLRGWFEYFKHSQKSVFRDLDGWIRRRLRAILNRRHRIRGWKNTRCPNLWPNDYFVLAGLFSMATARTQASQSHGRNH